MAEIVNIQQLNPTTFELQEYSVQDISLIPITDTFDTFDPTVDHIEYFIFDLNGNTLYSNVVGYPNFSLINNNVVIDPENDLKSQGYTEGNYNTLYNFLKNRVSSSPTFKYYIQQISTDRTEVRLNTTSISNANVIAGATDFINYRASSSVFIDFYLDFGNNNLVIANNILLDTTNPDNATVLIKLYEPLPAQFDTNSQCWVVETIAVPRAYNINITQTFDVLSNNIPLKGPNLNIAVKDQINNSTPFYSYNQLTSNNSSLGTGSLQYQINSILAEKGIEINIDYSDYSQFVFFASSQTQLENFYYKLSLLEQYQYSASIAGPSTINPYISSSNNVWLDQINAIMTGFSGYEYYLYYNSGSTSWPKTNSTYPYTNAGSNSVAGLAFLTSQSIVAENYDSQNNNRLINAIPSYLTSDPSNDQYMLFVDMVGQNFDSVWVYLKDVTNKFDADNRLNYGVSKDLIAEILRDLGVKIYQNNFSVNDLYSAFLGITPSGSLYNLPYTTGSLPTPQGYEYINNYVTASATGSLMPTYDINAETYKRIYNNLPYLLKKKGTVEGLRALITLYGVPDTILRINEFGGKDKNPNTWDNWQYEYNYALVNNNPSYSNSAVVTPWQLDPNWNTSAIYNRPQTIEFRFKPTSLQYGISNPSQSLWVLDNGNSPEALLAILYTGSGYTSGSYNGSIPDPYNQYANLVFYIDNTTTNTASVYLPFYNGDWWSVAVTTTDGITYNLYAGNSQYDGFDGNILGYFASSSVTLGGIASSWTTATTSSFLPGNGYVARGYSYSGFSGSLQEIRYYNTALNPLSFQDYIMNSDSIEGNGIDGGASQIAFRAALGGELYTGSKSIHPYITGSWVPTQSFSNGNSNFTVTNSIFVPNVETHFYTQVPAGIQNAISDKIQNKNIVLPFTSSNTNYTNIPNNNVLSPFISIQQNVVASSSYTANVDYVEVAFSPQNEINEDINDSLGYFNIGEFIGDPREIPSRNTHYPELDALRDYYFEKYTGNYNIWDYIRLIKYFDNSLFKMIQDWVPAHTDLASGVVIKQHLLERNRYPSPLVNIQTTQSYYGSGSNPGIYWDSPNTFEDITITASIRTIPGILDGQRIFTSSTQYESFPIELVSGSSGGVMPEFNGTASTNLYSNIVQVWTGSTPSLLGPVGFVESYQYEFFNGELSGSIITVDNGNLTDPANRIYLNASTAETPYEIIFYKSTNLGGSGNAQAIFLNANTAPGNGEMYIYWDSGSYYSPIPYYNPANVANAYHP
jgi:hypothetical protein